MCFSDDQQESRAIISRRKSLQQMNGKIVMQILGRKNGHERYQLAKQWCFLITSRAISPKLKHQKPASRLGG